MKAFIVAALAATAYAQGAAWAQCGGSGWTGSTDCVSGYSCVYVNDYYSQCQPSTGSTSPSQGSGSATTTGTPTTGTGTATKVMYAGINIAGFDFGCGTDGTCSLTGTNTPYDIVTYASAIPQIQHFVNDDTFNAFRLPVGWQFLVGGTLGGTLNSANFAKYDALMQGCISSGAKMCILDVHNYARWNGGIIGQGGPTNDQFVSLWTQLAQKYANQPKVAFGIMNEPHDVPNITTWAATVQAVVTAIRQAGATSQIILMPSNNWTSAQTVVSSGSGAALLGVKNPDGSTTNLIFDVHKYLDSDNSGTHTECVTDNIDSSFSPLATWLRQNNRQAFLSETGGGNTASCNQYMCSQLKYLNQNADVYLGYTTWAAGGFAQTYELVETPTKNGNSWTDTSLVTTCIAGVWKSS